MRKIAFQRSLSVRGLKILVTIVSASSLYCGSLATGQTTSSISVNGADDWKQVEAAMGRSGQMQPGDVIKFGMPRKDLHVVLDGVDIKPGLALGSWAAFKRDGSGTMVWSWFRLGLACGIQRTSVCSEKLATSERCTARVDGSHPLAECERAH